MGADKAAKEKSDRQKEFDARYENNKALIAKKIANSQKPIEQWHADVLSAVKQANRNYKRKGVFGLSPHTERTIIEDLFPQLKNNS